MSQCTPIDGSQEKSLLLIIQFTRTSPSFGRQRRIEALEQLVDRCSRNIRTNIDINEAALNTINISNQHRACLDAIRGDLTAEVHRQSVQTTDKMQVYAREELEVLGRALGTLRVCMREAEQGRECGISPPPYPSQIM